MSANDVTDFAARVRAALADLPAADMDALLEDLELHLAEVKAEGEGHSRNGWPRRRITRASSAPRTGPDKSLAQKIRRPTSRTSCGRRSRG